MHRSRSILALALVSCWFGCGVGDPQSTALPYPFHPSDDDGKADDGDSGSGGSTSSTTVGTSGTSVSSSSASGTSSSASGTSSSASTGVTTNVTATGAGATTGGGGNGVCSPDPGDSDCVSCAKDNCCLEVQACADDPDCLCWIDCLQQNAGAFDVCIGQCGLPGGEIFDLLGCSGDLCELECES